MFYRSHVARFLKGSTINRLPEPSGPSTVLSPSSSVSSRGSTVLSPSSSVSSRGSTVLSPSSSLFFQGSTVLSPSSSVSFRGSSLFFPSSTVSSRGSTVSSAWSRRFSYNPPMPQKQKSVKAQQPGAEPEASGPVVRDRHGALTITVHAKPGSKHSAITDVSEEAVGVSIAAPPTDGEANTELIRFLAQVLDLKKSHVSLHKGSRSRDKLVRVDSSLSVEEVLRRLRGDART
ncbi:UPF0235 protein C15orf40 homolog [Platichthys flesus]|uniref:UPF0235 protein C15orf40 homolog n=1 Tax=Platichthys flesus TaxID=8260 RepID=UPI002DB83373|nr:UPF0235 protein C15orf40 homolog [Platichthys flesus]